MSTAFQFIYKWSAKLLSFECHPPNVLPIMLFWMFMQRINNTLCKNWQILWQLAWALPTILGHIQDCVLLKEKILTMISVFLCKVKQLSVQEFKCLGITLIHNLFFKRWIKNTVNRIKMTLSNFRFIRTNLTHEPTKLYFNTLILWSCHKCPIA